MMKSISLKIGLFCAALLFAAFPARALDGVVVIANPSVKPAAIGTSALKAIYTDKTKYWKDGQAVVIVVLAEKTDAAIKQVSGMDGGQFKTFWQRLAFSGRGQEPKRANSASAVVSLVASTKGAVALVPTGTNLQGVKKLEVK